MAKILVFAEIQNNELRPVTFEILGKLFDHEVDVAFFHQENVDVTEQVKNYGVHNVYFLKRGEFYSPTTDSQNLVNLVKEHGYQYVFSGATSLAKDLIPRSACLLESGAASDVIHIDFQQDELTALRPLFAGKCRAEVKFTGNGPHFITVRPNALGKSEEEKSSTPSQSEYTTESATSHCKISSVIQGQSDRADLTEANIIVSGGRSLKSAENFSILEELADVLGATVGASRAAVDSGYAPHAMQVGQTGKTVSPSLYIACGISGAIQHLAGMRTSKCIVCINTDPDAPIFAKADYGIVGDLFKIVPLLKEEFKKIL